MRPLSVYRWHAKRYKALGERIERTDWLDDPIVCQFHSLSDYEVAIVVSRE